MKNLLIILGLGVLIVSCTKEIDVDLNEANQVIVIEGNYTGEDSTVLVRVTLTSSYFDSSPSPEINTADVRITDAQGNTTLVPSVGNGYYSLTGLAPDYGTDYVLSVNYDGQTYLAQCNMPVPVALEPITYQYFDGFFGGDGGYAPFLNFNDPAGIENYYQIVISQNSVTYDNIDEIQTQDDALTDGNFVQRPLFAGDFSQLGDTVSFEFRSVDKIMYNYTEQAADIAGGSDSGAPGNPITNWDNGALGYFNAYGVSRDTVIIQ